MLRATLGGVRDPRQQRIKNAIGPRVAKLRGQRGLSQERLAAQLQEAGLAFTRGILARIETSTRAVYDYEVIFLAQELGVPAGDLLLSPSQARPLLPNLRAGRKPPRYEQ